MQQRRIIQLFVRRSRCHTRRHTSLRPRRRSSRMVRRLRQRRLAHRVVVPILAVLSRRSRYRYAQLLSLPREVLVEQSLGLALLQLQHLAEIICVIVLGGHCAVGVLHVGQRAFSWYRGHHDAVPRLRSGVCYGDIAIRTRRSLSGVHRRARIRDKGTADGDRSGERVI